MKNRTATAIPPLVVFWFFLGALPGHAQEQRLQLWSIVERIRAADLVCAGRVEAVRPTATTTYIRGQRYRDLIADVSIDTVFVGEHETAMLSLVWKGWWPESGGYLYGGPPLAEYREGQRYLLFLRREAPAVFVPLDPFHKTELELAAAPAAGPLLPQADEVVRRRAIAAELAAWVRTLPDGFMSYEHVRWIAELLGKNAEPILQEFLHHSRPDVRVVSAEALVRLDLPVEPQVLLELLGNREYPYSVRGGAARLLGELRVAEARTLLESVAASDEHPQLRGDAFYALRELADRESVPVLVPLLDDPSEEIRFGAAGVLLAIATGKVIARDILKAHEAEIFSGLRSWAQGGLPPDVDRILQAY